VGALYGHPQPQVSSDLADGIAWLTPMGEISGGPVAGDGAVSCVSSLVLPNSM